MPAKKKIVVAIDWYLPGYKAGGPIRSCVNIISNLQNDFDFSVITSDTDFSDTIPYDKVKANQWNVLEDGTRVFYFSKENLNYHSLKKVIVEEKPDVLYMNSFFSRGFTLLPLRVLRKTKMNCKAIIAPRGMLGQGALAIKPLKKLVFISLSKMLGTFNQVRWHASTQQEANEVKTIFGNHAEVRVALNLSSMHASAGESKNKQPGIVNLVFFSRISRKKNLHLVFDFLAQINQNLKVNFDIYGTKEDEAYWKECEQLRAALPSNITVNYKGVVSSEKIPEVFSAYHFSILPTLHENYGHSIVESLACGVPVIISTQTPWKNLESMKAGWEIDLAHPEKFVEVIEKAAAMQNDEMVLWQKGSAALAAKVLNNTDTVNQNKALFNS